MRRQICQKVWAMKSKQEKVDDTVFFCFEFWVESRKENRRRFAKTLNSSRRRTCTLLLPSLSLLQMDWDNCMDGRITHLEWQINPCCMIYKQNSSHIHCMYHNICPALTARPLLRGLFSLENWWGCFHHLASLCPQFYGVLIFSVLVSF